MFKFKNKDRVTKDNLRIKINEGRGAPSKEYAVVIASAIYDEMLSEKTKDILGIPSLYKKDKLAEANVKQKASDEEKAAALLEFNTMCKKTAQYSKVCVAETKEETDKIVEGWKKAKDEIELSAAMKQHEHDYSVEKVIEGIRATDVVVHDTSSNLNNHDINLSLKIFNLSVSSIALSLNFASAF